MTVTVVNGAIQDPGFWDTTEEHLNHLIDQSRPNLMSPKEMGGRTTYCNTLPGYDEETVVPLSNATVLLLDEELLCVDFPDTCHLSSEEKREWMIQQTAWFSAPHIASGLHEIPHDSTGPVKVARRACSGGRALSIPVTSSGAKFVDIKGVGANNPADHSARSNVNHRNGLVAIQNAIWEYLNEKTLNAALNHHAQAHPDDEEQEFHTVGIYAVLSLGFEFQWERDEEDDFATYPAAAIVRQACRRHPNPYGFMDPAQGAILEQIMNAYGMRSDTSMQDYRFKGFPNQYCRRINIQATMKPREVTDMGNLYVDDSESWPPPETDCLVHWGKVFQILQTPLWQDDLGSESVRNFLREELRDLPVNKTTNWPAKPSNSVRQERLFDVAMNWWSGGGSIAEIEEAVAVGTIDNLLEVSENADDANDETLPSDGGHSNDEL